MAEVETSADPARVDAALLLQAIRGHWGIENRLHYFRDATFDEDRWQARGGAVPETLAACRNLVIGLLRRVGVTNIAAGLRTYAGRAAEAALLVLGTRLT